MLSARRRGFTLIELMIGIVLFALVLMLALPGFTTMLQNSKLRNAGESILAGLQTARAEALKRNQTVEFILTADPPDTNFAAFTTNAIGPGWAARVLDVASVPIDFVDAHSGLEGSGVADPAALYARITASNLPATGTIRFDPLGRTNVAGVTAFDVKPAAAGACKADGGDMRCLQVIVTPGGRVRMCDPSVDAVANPNDTRAC
ncbi:MAG: GspH/FimT family pseudopilin [Burkholderiales bacterium]